MTSCDKEKSISNFYFISDSSPKKGDLKYHRAKIVLLGGLPDDSTQEDVVKCLHKLYVTQDF